MTVTSSPPAATPVETVYVDAMFRVCDPQGRGFITGDAAVPVLQGSNLASSVLGDVWQIADVQNHGYLNRTEVGLLVRLLGWAQKGEKIRKSLLQRAGPLPIIEGLPLAAAARGEFAGSAALPQLTEAERKKYHGIFNGLGPKSGILPGPKCKTAFLTSELPSPTLALVWDLADTHLRGSLDILDFTLGMYFIRECLKRAPDTSFLPKVAPEWLCLQASTGQSAPSAPSPSIPPPSKASRTASSSGNSSQQAQEASWGITATEKRRADKVFAQLDSKGRGYLEGDVVVPYLLESHLEKLVLSHIWDLADIENKGHLTRDTFAVALHLVKWRQDGKALPKTLPESLIPPSMKKPSVTMSMSTALSSTASLPSPLSAGQSPSPSLSSSMTSSWNFAMQASYTSDGSVYPLSSSTASGDSIGAAYSQGLCVVCQTEEANMAITTCGHVALCQQCSELIMHSADRRCPICRGGIPSGDSPFLRIYRS